MRLVETASGSTDKRMRLQRNTTKIAATLHKIKSLQGSDLMVLPKSKMGLLLLIDFDYNAAILNTFYRPLSHNQV